MCTPLAAVTLTSLPQSHSSWNIRHEHALLGTGTILWKHQVHSPSSSSSSSFSSSLQVAWSGKFVLFNYGSPELNMRHYGQVNSLSDNTITLEMFSPWCICL